jgi:hypothetical protein
MVRHARCTVQRGFVLSIQPEPGVRISARVEQRRGGANECVAA